MGQGQMKRKEAVDSLLTSAKEEGTVVPVLRPEQMEALSYIREMVPALRILAANADLKFLTYLLEMASEEAELLAGNADPKEITRIAKSN